MILSFTQYLFRMTFKRTKLLKEKFNALLHGDKGELTIGVSTQTAREATDQTIALVSSFSYFQKMIGKIYLQDDEQIYNKVLKVSQKWKKFAPVMRLSFIFFFNGQVEKINS